MFILPVFHGTHATLEYRHEICFMYDILPLIVINFTQPLITHSHNHPINPIRYYLLSLFAGTSGRTLAEAGFRSSGPPCELCFKRACAVLFCARAFQNTEVDFIVNDIRECRL